MRSEVDPDKLRRLMKALGRSARGPGRIYLTGGASALLVGWRRSTVAVDIRLDPEPDGIFEAIARLKNELDVNVELASPQDFMPELPGWRDRSLFIERCGEVDFFHYDFYAQALSKLSRGHGRDRADVGAMFERGLIDVEGLRGALEATLPRIIRFPALDADVLRGRVEVFLKDLEVGDGEGG